MSDPVAELLGIDPHDDEFCRALDVASADLELIRQLREQRRRQNMTRQQVADAIGVPVAEIVAFEAPFSDPRMSFVRRYAQVVGAVIDHTIVVDGVRHPPAPPAFGVADRGTAD